MPSQQPAGPPSDRPRVPDAWQRGDMDPPRGAPGPAYPSRDRRESPLEAGGPSVLGVSRLSRSPYLSPAAEALYRRIARTAELGPESEFLLAPSARGLTTQVLASVSGASGAGVDPSRELSADAAGRARAARLEARLHFDAAPIDDLPYQDGVFDFAMGEIGIGASADPAAAVRELVRVVKPMGTVALIQLVWTRQLEDVRRESIVRMLGVRPMLLVEWKQLLRDAGAVELHVEDLTQAAGASGQPLLGVAGLLDFMSLRDRTGVLYGAWRRWGWDGVWQVVLHGKEVRHLIARERVLGLALIRGTRWRGSSHQGGAGGPIAPAAEPNGTGPASTDIAPGEAT